MKQLAVSVVAMTMLVTTASAQDAVSDHIGMIGLGYYTMDAPIGFRYWSSESMGFEAGIGFRTRNQEDIQENGDMNTTSLTSFAFEAGVLMVMNSDDNMILFLRPGIGFSSEQEIIPAPQPEVAGDQTKESTNVFSLSAMIGAEFFMSKLGFTNLSFGGGYGFIFATRSEAGRDDSITSFGSAVAGVDITSSSELGFHLYF